MILEYFTVKRKNVWNENAYSKFIIFLCLYSFQFLFNLEPFGFDSKRSKWHWTESRQIPSEQSALFEKQFKGQKTSLVLRWVCSLNFGTALSSECLKSELIWISDRHSITLQFPNSSSFRHFFQNVQFTDSGLSRCNCSQPLMGGRS